MGNQRLTEDKLPPHDIDAEEALLGSLLIDEDAYSEIGGLVKADDFYREKNGWIFSAIEALVQRERAVDQVTVGNELSRSNKLEAAGGLAYLSHLIAQIPTSLHAAHYARIVAKAAFARRVISTAHRIEVAAHNGHESEELVEQIQDYIKDLQPATSTGLITSSQYAELTLSSIDTRRQAGPNVTWGWQGIEELTGGLYPGNLIIVGGRPGMGKSQLLLQIFRHNAGRGKHILMASAEMLPAEYGQRELSTMTGIDMKRILCGRMNDEEWGKVQDSIAVMSERNVCFMKGRIGVTQIAGMASKMAASGGLDLIIVDFIQRLQDRVRRASGDNTRERIGYISNELKNLAQELEVPVLAASQLNRDCEQRENKRPILPDLKESGSLEEDADQVVFLYRDEKYYKPTPETEGVLEMIVAKVRQIGELGTVRLYWNPRWRRYESRRTE